ncbi:MULTISPECIES: hypothetical protein [unclassified Archaeoglobus]|jgi:hypothetical protein|uniref:hypothetical protein n=1 Tax=unclassified Archaeoglobus TaxID=2643606 RepID=UPI0025BF2AA6|nr:MULTISPECIES: hypothetical protein [unclassified Archaeoglobus]
MGRKRNVYLGKRVKDVGMEGLDDPREFKGIMRAIENDLKNRRISIQEARGRLLLLYRLTDPSKNSKVRNWSNKTRSQIQQEIRRKMSQLDDFNFFWNL